MKLTPDQTILWQYGDVIINATLVWTWVIMLVMVIASRLITRNLKSDLKISHWQCVLEMIVTGIRQQMKEIGLKEPEKYIGFLGTLFLFIAVSNLCIIFPFYEPPTSSLSTTAALALCVFVAVPFYGIMEGGLLAYLKTYLEPTFVMLPFNIISEISRTLALAIRLFGNIMSGGVIISILLSVTPLFFPIIMNALGLLTGMVQAYIFSVLATVYIAAATAESLRKKKSLPQSN
ncbi:MAG: F0F1 ATP synthase subunit A [Bacteroidetes bacterium]|nr:F0F1 ATP synthase subunit A [Bacteroidota bacterium]